MYDKVTIKIPSELYHRLSEMIQGTGFSEEEEKEVKKRLKDLG